MKVAPWHFVLAMLAGWIHREQQKVIDYLKEENGVSREQLGGGRIWLSDDQRRLAAKGENSGAKRCRISAASSHRTPFSVGTGS
jgi:hypothetical protein